MVMQTGADRSAPLRIMLGGDVMLGRGVAQHILWHGPEYPLGPVSPLLRAADLALVNLECTFTASSRRWTGRSKSFYFNAPPEAVRVLDEAGIDMVSLANNHVLDFGNAGLRETLRALRHYGIRFSGAGKDLDAATAPAIIRCGSHGIGMVAFCDHQADFAADRDQPGIAYLDFDDELAVLATFRNALGLLRHAPVDWPILSLHWGPNMAFRPSTRMRRLAHAAIGMGWKVVFGHSAHVFQGIELYRGCPIVYAAGDLVDDYLIDPCFKNDHQLLFELEFGADRLRRIRLHPVIIENCQSRPAAGEQFAYIAQWMRLLCHEMGTHLRQAGSDLWIDADDAGAGTLPIARQTGLL